MVFDWSAVLRLVKRGVDSRNFVVLLYARTPVLRKELKWPSL